MTTPRILALFLLLSTIVHAEDADSKNLEHAKMLQRLYPTPALQVVIRNEVSYQIYQEAVNDAYHAGVIFELPLSKQELRQWVESRSMSQTLNEAECDEREDVSAAGTGQRD